MNKFAATIAATFLMVSGGAAHAALVGDTVTCLSSEAGTPCAPTSALVEDPGVEFGLIASSFFTIDLDDVGALFVFNNDFSGQPSLSVTIGDLNFSSGAELLGFDNLQIGQTFSGFDAGDISTTVDSFTVDLTGISVSDVEGDSFSFDFVTGPATVVPLPAAIWMLGGALFLLGASRRFSAT